MGAFQENNFALSAFPTSKITVMEESLTQAVANFRDLVLEFEQLHLENIGYKKLVHEQKEKLECQTCTHCEELKQVVADKEQIIDSLSSVLNKLTETKDFNLIDVTLKQIYGKTDILTPPRSVSPQKENIPIIKSVSPQKENIPIITTKENIKEEKVESMFKSPKKELKDQMCKDESLSEIEGTPTGRKSPIFQNRKTKINRNLSLKDKKKCPDSWPSPDSKAIKLTFPTPARSKSGGRLRQGRLSFVKTRSCNVIDLTCSPEASGGAARDENVQFNLKKEVIDNDETILPSPTSGPVKLPLYKSTAKDSPSKFIKPPVTSKLKIEDGTSDHNIERKFVNNENGKDIDHSINLLNQFPNRFKSPMKQAQPDDEIHCGDESISLLQHNLKKVDSRNNNQQVNSPSKQPLAENVNIMNMQNHEKESSMSILHRVPETTVAVKSNDDVVKRVKTNMAPVYKEPTVRKKAEKRALPGWSCEQCKNFYDEMYKDDPEMLAQKMEECSKHRGRTNPARPKTPDGFWYPRWDVPQDTEEFNRRNNAN